MFRVISCCESHVTIKQKWASFVDTTTWSFILKTGSLSAAKAKETTTQIAYSWSSDEQNRIFVKGKQITNSLKYLLHVDN